jgi:hypothetical protein
MSVSERPSHPVLCVLEAQARIGQILNALSKEAARAGLIGSLLDARKITANAQIPLAELAKLLALGCVSIDDHGVLSHALTAINGGRARAH